MLIQKPPNLHQFNSSNQNLSTRIVLKLAAFSVSSLLEVKLHGRTLLPLKQKLIGIWRKLFFQQFLPSGFIT